MRIQKPKKKLYYSLRQVVEMLELPDTVIKTWESIFPQLKPVRNRAGNRSYVEKDLALLFYIKKLMFEEKKSIEEIQECLKERRINSMDNHPVHLKRVLSEVKMELKEILEILSG